MNALYEWEKSMEKVKKITGNWEKRVVQQNIDVDSFKIEEEKINVPRKSHKWEKDVAEEVSHQKPMVTTKEYDVEPIQIAEFKLQRV